MQGVFFGGGGGGGGPYGINRAKHLHKVILLYSYVTQFYYILYLFQAFSSSISMSVQGVSKPYDQDGNWKL